MNRLKLAVVGVGALGRHHARILSGFEDVELTAVVDAHAEQGQRIAEQFATRWFPQVSMLPHDLDGVIVAVPTVLHSQIAIPLLQNGTAVLIEKPLAATLEDSRRLQAAADESGAILQVGHVERFNPAFEQLAGQVKRPLYIRCQRVSPYTFRSTDIGVVHDLMIHDIDLVLSLLQDDVTSVDAFGAVTIGPHEDLAVARLKTASGAVVDLTAGRMSPAAERSIQVWTPDGWFAADLTSRQVQSWQAAAPFNIHPALVHSIIGSNANPQGLKDEVFTRWLTHSEQHAGTADALTSELRDFIDSVRNESQPRVDGMAGVRAMEVADRILKQMNLWSYQSDSDRHDTAAASRNAA
ncbi:MAG: Gfo/Idh/MocA family oxidoreductase [Planctomycetaceae bacterium]|nr:Gfo/Idh/MocA family oxidoreductase [Planctomycetaceae bacterium]